jgi:hypothetical protein
MMCGIVSSERSEAATQRTKSARAGFQSLIMCCARELDDQPEMFESLGECFAFRCSASLNSPPDESAVADMTIGYAVRSLHELGN